MSHIRKIRDIVTSLQREKLSKERELRDAQRENDRENQRLFLGLIDNLDNLQQLISKSDKYLTLTDPGAKRFVNTLGKIEKGILEQLGRSHVTPIDFNQGDEAIPQTSQVVDTVKTSEQEKAGKVFEIIKKGYFYKNKVLRFAQVITYTYQDENSPTSHVIASPSLP